MGTSRQGDVTGLLVAWKNGSPDAVDEPIPIVHGEIRHFGGLSLEETAEVLRVSPATVKRDWRVAKLRLRRALEGTALP